MSTRDTVLIRFVKLRREVAERKEREREMALERERKNAGSIDYRHLVMFVAGFGVLVLMYFELVDRANGGGLMIYVLVWFHFVRTDPLQYYQFENFPSLNSVKSNVKRRSNS